MSNTKHTPGPLKVLPYYGSGGENLLGFDIVQEGNRETSDRVAILKFSDAYRDERETTDANALLICEAFNVATETGMTPYQMQGRIAMLQAQLKDSDQAHYNSRVVLHQINDELLALIVRFAAACGPDETLQGGERIGITDKARVDGAALNGCLLDAKIAIAKAKAV